jgi:transcriptional regulator with XRE-family HTH domain
LPKSAFNLTRLPVAGVQPAEKPANMDVLERFGANLLRIRQARRLSQESLAERAGIHRTQISLFETGQRQPLLETFVRLAGALEVPLSTLLEGIAFKPGPAGGEFLVSDPPELPRIGS